MLGKGNADLYVEHRHTGIVSHVTNVHSMNVSDQLGLKQNSDVTSGSKEEVKRGEREA